MVDAQHPEREFVPHLAGQFQTLSASLDVAPPAAAGQLDLSCAQLDSAKLRRAFTETRRLWAPSRWDPGAHYGTRLQLPIRRSVADS